jgi:hypothetical protein
MRALILAVVLLGGSFSWAANTSDDVILVSLSTTLNASMSSVKSEGKIPIEKVCQLVERSFALEEYATDSVAEGRNGSIWGKASDADRKAYLIAIKSDLANMLASNLPNLESINLVEISSNENQLMAQAQGTPITFYIEKVKTADGRIAPLIRNIYKSQISPLTMKAEGIKLYTRAYGLASFAAKLNSINSGPGHFGICP